MNRRSTFLRLLTASLLAAFAAGCAQSNGDVVRVQPNVVRKADLLDGEWFFRNTVTWTPFNTQFTFPGQTGNMEKLVWEIQEGNLVGYRSYPYTLGAESNIDQTSIISGTTAKYCDENGVCKGGKKYYGAPVVAFPILSHFDIQRGYNPATAEPTNVISENSTDRIWNQREFIRVNWAMNILNQGSGMNWGTVQNPGGPAQGVSQQNWIQPNESGSDPYDWPTFEYSDRDNDGQDELTYFDVTGRYMVAPDSIFFEGYGNIPLCWFAAGIYDCSSAEIHIRTSISKVEPSWSRDYEPLQFPNDLMSYFGYFRTDRLNYDRKWGYNDSAVIRLAQRHRVWKEYYQKENGEVTDRAIPMAQREPSPIKYYFTPANRMGGEDRYAEFWEPGQVIDRDFDRAFRRAIGAAQGKRPEDVRKMFYVCNNPVKSGDPLECGNPGFSPKVGDLRFSFINTVAEPVANGLLGYGPSSADPETGQLISGMSNTYTWGVDMYGRSVANWILLLNGEQSIADYISGEQVQDFVKNNPVYNISKLQKSGLIQSELQGIPNRNVETVGAWDRPSQRMSAVIQSMVQDRNTIAAKGDSLKRAAEELAKHPEVEAAVLDNPDVQADLVNLLPAVARGAAAKDPAFLRNASRSVLTNIKLSQRWEEERIKWLSKNSITTFDFYDRTLVGFATQMLTFRNSRVSQLNAEGKSVEEARRMADDEIARKVRQQVWLGTSLHEAGHTLNLRHNFQGSFDSINYFDEYWDIRRPTLTVQQNNQAKVPRTPADLKKASEGTEAQLIEGLHDYEYSSIMDYSGKIFGDWKGLGRYDEAAIIFAYSGDEQPGYVEVFENARPTSKVVPGSDGANLTISGAGADLPLVNVTHTNPNVRNYTERFHYSLVPLHFGEGNDVGSIINDGLLKLRQRRLVKWSEVVEDEKRVAAALAADPTLIDDPDRASGVFGNALLRVPYMFCSDESADGPVLSCNRFDRGPDYYEITRTKLEDYWNYYIDTHFRRDSAFFSGNGALNRTFGTFYTVANSYKHWVYEVYQKSARGQEQVQRYKLDPLMQDYWTMAVLDGVNQHLNVMSVPPDGLFMYRNITNSGGPRWDMISQGDDYDYLNPVGRQRLEELYTSRFGAQDFIVIPRGLGRRMYSRYDFKSGFGFFNRMNEAGHYNDQVGAMFAAVIPEIQVQGVDVNADWDRYNIPYYLIFRDEFQNTFSSLWANDEEKIRPVAYRTVLDSYPNGGAAGNGISDKAAIEWRTYVRGTDFFTGFTYPRERSNCVGNQNPLVDNCWVASQNPAPANIQLTYTSRIYGLFLGMALFKVNYDLDYAKANQIYKLGSGDAFTLAQGYHTIELQDAVTGHRYIAIEKDGAPPNSTGAVRMINIGNEYLQMVQNPATCPLPPYVFFQGFTCLPAEQANNPAILEDRRKYWTEIFQDHVRDLDMQRSMYQIFGKAF